DASGNRDYTIDANDNRTDFVYDAADELVRQVRPAQGALATSYDAAGNVATQVDGAGVPTAYAYDALNRPSGTSIYFGTVLSDTPVGYWRLSEPTGTTAADL